jgi:pimeloyl-ACP methyl ester carboxylesterase
VAIFVLVHGAWGGAHTFRRVRPLLTAHGHEVFTPSLTGLGERSHLASPQVNLSTHIQDVVNVVWYEDLSDLVLLGFSYGGFVVTGTIAYLADRVRHLVYLDAFVPADGQTLSGLTGQQGDPVLRLGQRWLVPAPARTFDDPVDEAFAARRRGPHPVGCFTEPVRLPRPVEDYPFGRTYIKASAEPPGESPFWTAARHAQASPAWDYEEIATDHMIPVNRPHELADLLLKLVS